MAAVVEGFKKIEMNYREAPTFCVIKLFSVVNGHVYAHTHLSICVSACIITVLLLGRTLTQPCTWAPLCHSGRSMTSLSGYHTLQSHSSSAQSTHHASRCCCRRRPCPCTPTTVSTGAFSLLQPAVSWLGLCATK